MLLLHIYCLECTEGGKFGGFSSGKRSWHQKKEFLKKAVFERQVGGKISEADPEDEVDA